MIAALIRQDMRLALSGGALLPLVFAALVIALMGVGLSRMDQSAPALAGTIVWVILLLSALLSLERLLEADRRDGTLDLTLLEIGPMGLALCKILVHWTTSLAPLLLLLPLASLFLSLPVELLPTLAASLLIGSPAVSALATLGAALTLVARRGAVLAPVLLLPLLLPSFLFAIGALARQADGGSPAEGLYFLAAATALTLVIAPPATAAALSMAAE